MCGGIVALLCLPGERLLARGTRQVLYNVGRMLTYVLLGVAAGGIGEFGLAVSARPLAPYFALLANVLLVVIGCTIAGMTRALAPLERLGSRLWTRLQPAIGDLLPADSPEQAFGVGLLWGLLPCGMVYTALGTAFASGSAFKGGCLMFAFGAGTLPNLLIAGVAAEGLRKLLRNALYRYVAGGAVAVLGLVGLIRAVGRL
jgi:sulfite exporter TauE/SafE